MIPLRHSPQDRSGAPGDAGEYLMDVQVLDGRNIEIIVRMRQKGDGRWYGGITFSDPASGETRRTAEILRGASEGDIWLAVRGLRTHHFRDLYRSLA